jgi:uncharacterized protein YjdB
MTQIRLRATHVIVLFLIAIALLDTAPALAQDVITVGSVTTSGPTVDVPVYVRDVSGTPLGRDNGAGLKIQGYSLTVAYTPTSAVQSVTFSRAGITAGLTPGFENSSSPSGSVSLLDSFDESTNLIPFTLNSPGSGDQVAHLIVTLSSSAAPGSSISLMLDPSLTALSNQSGNLEETPGNGVALVNGSINIAQLSLNIVPGTSTVAMGDSTTLTAQTSSNVVSNTTVTLASSNPSIATVPPSVVIPAGTNAANFTVAGVSLGSVNINGALPAANGGGTASAFVTVTQPPPQCAVPNAPQISGPSTSDLAKSYAITWAIVNDSTDYFIEESTDANFGTVVTSTTTGTSASFTHAAANRYYYRVHARNLSTGCSTSGPLSNVVSVLVSAIPVAQTRILPVVGSVPGNFGSLFKTSVQLFNVKGTSISGKIVFHAQNTSGASTDPALAFSLQPGKSLFYPDLLPAMGIASGLGSADLIADAGSSFPVTLVRVFNDAGIAGTTGLAEDSMATSDVLQNGDSGALIAPPDQRFRLNIGVRTLEQGASMTFTVRDKDGNIVKTSTRTFGATFFQQAGSATLLDGYALTGGETIVVQMTAGSAFVYGSTTDNTTQDPSVQFAKKVE